MPRKGMKTSEETRKKMSIAKTKNRKCSLDGCNNKHEAHGLCKSHWGKFRRKNDPEYKDRINKRGMQDYFKHQEKRKKSKNTKQKLVRAELYRKLGAKCASCGEKFNPDLSRSNLEIHHKSYDDVDERIKKKFKGNIGSRHHWELKRMIKNGINPKKKFVLLCTQCHDIETASHQNPKKTFDMFAWMYGEGLFDQALKDDPTLKKLTEFLK